MAQDIYLNLEQLKSDIIALNAIKLQEIDTSMRAACNAVATLTAYGWSGDAKDAFMEKFTDYKRGMSMFCANIKELNKQLNTIHNNGKKLLGQGNKIAAKL